MKIYYVPSDHFQRLSKYCAREAGRAQFESITSFKIVKVWQYETIRRFWRFVADIFESIGNDNEPAE